MRKTANPSTLSYPSRWLTWNPGLPVSVSRPLPSFNKCTVAGIASTHRATGALEELNLEDGSDTDRTSYDMGVSTKMGVPQNGWFIMF